ncbi:hypothetical protein C4556_03565 [Candidatus Parcubacteria bacterium]|nr:MAG: hypothetical protein C4556_03565 [Candidatus Parcubacteria bacterium]
MAMMTYLFYRPSRRKLEQVTAIEYLVLHASWPQMISGPVENFNLDGELFGRIVDGPLSVDAWDEWLQEAALQAGIPIVVH